MLATRRQRKEITEVNVYLNSKPLQQAKSIKYLGITLDTKLNFWGAYYFHNKQMYPVHTHISKISKTKLGT